MSIIVLKDKNVSEIIQEAIRKKQSAHKFLMRTGHLEQANFIYHEWSALIEIAELLGLQFTSISDEDKVQIKKVNSKMTKDQLEKLVILIYLHFNRYRMLHIREFEKLLNDIIENE